ncbi:hypothetical protein [Streptomyces sp. NPDC004250]|uniref:hypothetical protein n=1 Tax=Streptomyces sp. NPDC004250 TaxID=3364692 RepID=UPI0036BF0C69
MSTADAYALAVFACTLGVAVGWCIGRYGRRTAARAAERAARPPGPHPIAIADELALGLKAFEEACCDPGFVSRGLEHAPATCARKDQPT